MFFAPHSERERESVFQMGGYKCVRGLSPWQTICFIQHVYFSQFPQGGELPERRNERKGEELPERRNERKGEELPERRNERKGEGSSQRGEMRGKGRNSQRGALRGKRRGAPREEE